MNTEEIKFLKKLGEKIANERKNQGLSQKFLAEESGMNRSSLMRIKKVNEIQLFFLCTKLLKF